MAHAGLAAIVAAAILHARSYSGVVIDDSFTTFRHASNLVHGHGFTCNPGEHVEGTSSPLFGLAVALPIALRMEPDRVAAWLATIAFAGCVVLAYTTVRSWLRDATSRVLGLGAAAVVAASPILAFHSQTALETLPYACVFAAAYWLFLDCLRTRSGSLSWAVAMGIASLLRPEGFAFFLCLLGLAGALRFGHVGALRQARRELGAFLLLWAPWLLFRLAYYHKWWPNSVLAKSGHVNSSSVRGWVSIRDLVAQGAGTEMLSHFVATHVVEITLLIGALLLTRIRLPVLVAIAMTLGYAAVVTWNGGDWMLHYRFLTPCITPLAVASALGLRAFLFHREQRNLGHWPSATCTVLVFGFAVASARRLPTDDLAIKDLPRMREVGLRLASVRRSDDSVVSTSAGILPYYWGAATTDAYGICDTHIAESGKLLRFGVGRYDASYMAALKPTFFAFEYASLAADFYASREFAADRAAYFMVQYPFGYLGSKGFSPPALFVRKDRPEVERVAAALGAKLVDAGRELCRVGLLTESRLAQ